MKELDRNFNKAQKMFSDINIENGKKIFQSQNCSSCHKMENEKTWFEEHNAPDLSGQKMRTKDHG